MYGLNEHDSMISTYVDTSTDMVQKRAFSLFYLFISFLYVKYAIPLNVWAESNAAYFEYLVLRSHHRLFDQQKLIVHLIDIYRVNTDLNHLNSLIFKT